MPEKFEFAPYTKPVVKPLENNPFAKRREKRPREGYVFQRFHKLADFKIETIPQLHERLIELASITHFEDAVKMAEMVDLIAVDLQQKMGVKFNKIELKLACLLHDIGKSGPKNANREQRRLIQMLFNPKFFNSKLGKFKEFGLSPKDMVIADAIAKEDQLSPQEKRQLIAYLKTLQVHIYDPKTKKAKPEKLDIKKHKMIDIWREHDYWTWDILNEYGKDSITDEVKKIASTHHALEGHDPAQVDGYISAQGITLELMDKYMMLTIIDKYQAWVKRAGVSHDQAIKELKKQIDDSKKAGIISLEVKKQYYKYLNIIKKYNNLPQIVNTKEIN